MRVATKDAVPEILLVIGTLLVALILTLIPMARWLIIFRPLWIVLVLIFWALVLPGKSAINLSWVVGILLDVLNGTLLGEHAFALTAAIYSVARLRNQLRMFSLFQQSISVFFVVLFYQFILFCIQGFLGDLPERWFYWLPAVTSMLLWPWTFTLMKDWYRHFET